MSGSIRVIIVDDERLGRQKVRKMLKDEEGVEIVAELDGGKDTVAKIADASVDLLLLDVQLPGQTGFDIARGLGDRLPHVIFITAFDQYALQAFEINAVDYLLKPFDRERFAKALKRARESIERTRGTGVDQRLLKLLESLKPQKEYPERVVVKSGGHVFFLRTEEIEWVEAAGNYVRLHASGKSYLHRQTMSDLESSINPEKFVRIHRSTIVNIDQIKELQPWFGGGYIVILANGQKLTMSRAYKGNLNNLLQGKSVSDAGG